MQDANLAKEQALTNGKELQIKNHEMEQFVYTVSHDLKNPLVTIVGYATMLRQINEDLKPNELANATQRIELAAKTMYQSINELLELSRIGRVVQDPSNINTNQPRMP